MAEPGRARTATILHTATSAGYACLSDGEQVDYVYANGSSGFKVWKQHSGTNILQASGRWASSSDWQQTLNANGKGFSGTLFNYSIQGSGIAGRSCPVNGTLPSVYINDSDKVDSNYCLYYDSGSITKALNYYGTTQTSPDIGLASWSSALWYVGNYQFCANEGMRLPTAYETQTTRISNSNYPTDASPTFASTVATCQGGSSTCGAPSGWTASSDAIATTEYWYQSGTNSFGSVYSNINQVVCVLP